MKYILLLIAGIFLISGFIWGFGIVIEIIVGLVALLIILGLICGVMGFAMDFMKALFNWTNYWKNKNK